MARETKVEREAREQAERHAQEQEAMAIYPINLMLALERACKHGWDLAVENGKFVVGFYDDYNDRCTLELPPTMTVYDSWSPLDRLESELHSADLREAEYARKAALRQSAIAKLSKEEREELGL